MRSLTSSALSKARKVRSGVTFPLCIGLISSYWSSGKGTTFYSWLNVPSTATTAEISKAYRKKSMQLQYVDFYRFTSCKLT